MCILFILLFKELHVICVLLFENTTSIYYIPTVLYWENKKKKKKIKKVQQFEKKIYRKIGYEKRKYQGRKIGNFLWKVLRFFLSVFVVCFFGFKLIFEDIYSWLLCAQ
jgi:uncharacterized membrane protein